MTTERAAEMATLMDPAPGEDDRCPEMSEQALHWMELGAKAVAKDPTPMLRASVVDLRAPARRPAADELRALLASPAAAESYAVGPPECPAGFVRALLPGCVQADGWDNVPVSGYRYDVCHPEWGDEDLPYIELARAHPGDGAAPQTFPGTTAESYDNRAFAPLTTRAGGRVWSVYYAAPDGGVAALNAAYPCQILVRHDAVNRKLVLDVCDFAPTLEGRMNALYARALANPNDYAALDAVATRDELKSCDRLARATRHKRTQMGGMFNAAQAMQGGMLDGPLASMIADHARGGDDDEAEEDPLAPLKGGSQLARIEKLGAAAIRRLEAQKLVERLTRPARREQQPVRKRRRKGGKKVKLRNMLSRMRRCDSKRKKRFRALQEAVFAAERGVESDGDAVGLQNLARIAAAPRPPPPTRRPPAPPPAARRPASACAVSADAQAARPRTADLGYTARCARSRPVRRSAPVAPLAPVVRYRMDTAVGRIEYRPTRPAPKCTDVPSFLRRPAKLLTPA